MAVHKRGSRLPSWRTVALSTLAAIAVVQFYGSAAERPRPFMPFGQEHGIPGAMSSDNAFGSSRAVRVRFAMPGEAVEFPIQVGADPTALRYAWVPLADTTSPVSERTFAGSDVAAPTRPGFYHMLLVRGQNRSVLHAPVLAVMVPFAAKIGGIMNGYRIGTYLSERLRSHSASPRSAPPRGFIEVREPDADIPVSAHFRLRDFLTHDGQEDVWPKYVALNPHLLDKLELVIAKLAEWRAASKDTSGNPRMPLVVRSGFRTPTHNAVVRRAARDSRHQYGDAADVAMNVDGNGRVTANDALLVLKAVEQVEAEHPELVGGLGLYTSRRYRTPYVHIDVRGKRSRWRG